MIRKLVVSIALALLIGSAFGQEGRYVDPQGRYAAPIPAGWTVEATPVPLWTTSAWIVAFLALAVWRVRREEF